MYALSLGTFLSAIYEDEFKKEPRKVSAKSMPKKRRVKTMNRNRKKRR